MTLDCKFLKLTQS